MLNIGERPLRNLDFIRALAGCKSKKSTQQLLHSAGADQLLCLVEICLNLVKDRYILSRRARNRLCKHSEHINALARKRSDRTTRSWCLANAPQRGRGVPAIVASVLAPLIAKLVLKKIGSGSSDADNASSD